MMYLTLVLVSSGSEYLLVILWHSGIPPVLLGKGDTWEL